MCLPTTHRSKLRRPAKHDDGRFELRTLRESDSTPGTPQTSPQASIYASPRIVTDLSDCYFYHTMDVPGYGQIVGEWDLREGIRAYLGDVDFRGRRVLEMGTANGFVCFHMEREGADVVAY